MKHIDLIVDALEYCDAGVLAVQKIEEALEAARELQDMEPTAWIYNGKLHEVDPSDWAEGKVTPLYKLDKVKE